MPFFYKKIIVWTLDLELQVMRYSKELTVVLCKATWVHGKVTMAKRRRKKPRIASFKAFFSRLIYHLSKSL
jgi:hypothetical protein